MIHTVTLNPSIDVTVQMDRLKVGEVQQLANPTEDPGGKGMNVARALDGLDKPVIAWVFLGGDRGKRWQEAAETADVPLEIITLSTETRQNIKLSEEGANRETELNFQGADYEESVCKDFVGRLSEQIVQGNLVVVAGSPLKGTPFEFWDDLATSIRAKGGILIADMSGPGLIQIAKTFPFLIKINREEFNDWFGLACVSLNEVYVALQNRESLESHLLVTDGPAGTLAWTKRRNVYRQPAAKVKVAGTVGAGDAYLAGFLAEWDAGGEDWESAMRWGSATAAGAIELEGIRFAKAKRVNELLKSF